MSYDIRRHAGAWSIFLAGADKPVTRERFSKREAIRTARLLAGWRGTVTVQGRAV